MKVLLDTNALMMPEQFGVDIFSELERWGYVEHLVPEAVIRELTWLSENAGSGRDKRAARVGLGLAEGCQKVEGQGHADDVLEELALKTGAAVLTSDKALKKRLFSRGITVIYLRQSRYLELCGRNSDV
ncbi:MAG: DNA-binding protein [Methanosarcinales archaeon]|nr:DNA-binding protein [Methanosarcinales archaeon]